MPVKQEHIDISKKIGIWISIITTVITIGKLVFTTGVYKGKIDTLEQIAEEHKAQIKDLKVENESLFREVLELRAKVRNRK